MGMKWWRKKCKLQILGRSEDLMAMAMLGSRAPRAVLLGRGLVTACVSKPVNWLNTQTHWGRISVGGVKEGLFITSSSGHSYYHEAVAYPLPTFLIPTRSGKDSNNKNSWLGVPGAGSLWYMSGLGGGEVLHEGMKSYCLGFVPNPHSLLCVMNIPISQMTILQVRIYPFYRKLMQTEVKWLRKWWGQLSNVGTWGLNSFPLHQPIEAWLSGPVHPTDQLEDAQVRELSLHLDTCTNWYIQHFALEFKAKRASIQIKEMCLLLSVPGVGWEATGCRILRKEDEIVTAFRVLLFTEKGGMGMGWDGRVESACVWERRNKYQSLPWIGYKYNQNSERESIVWPGIQATWPRCGFGSMTRLKGSYLNSEPLLALCSWARVLSNFIKPPVSLVVEWA